MGVISTVSKGAIMKKFQRKGVFFHLVYVMTIQYAHDVSKSSSVSRPLSFMYPIVTDRAC